MSSASNVTALLVMDVQPGVIERIATPEKYLDGVRAAVAHAHGAGFPVIYVVVGFRPGLPEISERNKAFSGLKEMAQRMIDPKPALEVAAGDIVVTKRRVSAFTGSDLEVVLRGQNVEHLVLCGIATSGVVLSTLREAADKDYRITVLADLCADADPEVHSVLLEKVFPRQANVLTSADWIAGSDATQA